MGWIKGSDLWVRKGREAEGVVIVVKKAVGTAVVRNRLKRRLRSICRELSPRSGSLVILPQSTAAVTSFTGLKEELRGLVARMDAPRDW